jgi:error-prone DNA polymerase
MHYRRAELRHQHILSAAELKFRNDGEHVRTAGCIIARQRPDTAKGFIFLSMEDKTGIANVIITPELLRARAPLSHAQQIPHGRRAATNQDGVIHVKAQRLMVLSDSALELRSHDFHYFFYSFQHFTLSSHPLPSARNQGKSLEELPEEPSTPLEKAAA